MISGFEFPEFKLESSEASKDWPKLRARTESNILFFMPQISHEAKKSCQEPAKEM